jgi:hypothetical protein
MSESDERPSYADSGWSRRDIFRTAGLAAAAPLLLALPKFMGAWSSEAHAALKQSYSAGAIALELDGVSAGLLDSAEGGSVFADIVPEGAGPDLILRKRPGPPRYEDIVLQAPMGTLSGPLLAWIKDTLGKGSSAKNGALLYLDMNYHEVKRLEFTGGMLSEIGFSAFEAQAAKQPATVLLRLMPQSTRFAGGKGSGQKFALSPKSKPVLASNFRFNVQGFENACKRIVKVERLTAKRQVGPPGSGQEKFRTQQQSGTLDCLPVSISLPEADAGPFYSWLDDTVVKGMQGKEFAALLEWLDPAGTNAQASLQLGGLGIVRYAPEPATSNHEGRGLVRVDMYCETMNLNL